MLARTTSLAVALSLSAGLCAGVQAAPELPLTDLTLYRSGVGSFTHIANIEGTETFDLRFATEAVDDVLKSLLMLDSAEGGSHSVSYQSREDLSRRLAKFSINLSAASSTTDLFNQLRGVEVTLTTSDTTRTGTILGVERRSSADRSTSPPTQTNESIVNIITDTGIRSIPIDTINNYTFTDKELADELNRALRTLVENRTDNVRDMAITFANDSADRRAVAITYVREMPVWKTAYRVVIPDEKDADATGKLTLQAMAIIENTTAADWSDVRLSLAAGRPISFTMDLDKAIYAPRPNYPVPVFGGLANLAKAATQFASSGAGLGYSKRAREESMRDLAAQSEMALDGMNFADEARLVAPSMTRGSMGDALSSGDQAGGQFIFTLDSPLNLESQQSAMLPIASTSVTGDAVSFYSFDDVPKHPLLGIRFTNDTGLHLMPGPVTVYDADRYAGDAQIPHTSRNDEKRFTFALDLDVHATRTTEDDRYDVSHSINEGLLRKISRHERTFTYTLKNLDSRTRTVVIEHRKVSGIVLGVPEDEKHLSKVTREITIEPGESTSIDIVERSQQSHQYRMGEFDADTFIATATEGTLSEPLIAAMKKASRMKRDISSTESQISRHSDRIKGIFSDQSRIRSNMNKLDRNSELYQIYYTKLTDQEHEIAELELNIDTLKSGLATKRSEYAEFLSNLNIDAE